MAYAYETPYLFFMIVSKFDQINALIQILFFTLREFLCRQLIVKSYFTLIIGLVPLKVY